jgi:ABC-2 type transport system ATP-binding protein
MVPNILSEIADYLKHQDYSLVVRRMLDASLDTGDPVLIRKAIQFSQQYRDVEKQQPGGPMPSDFLTMAEQLLKEAAPYYIAAAPLPQELLNATGISKTYSKGSFQLKPVSLKISSGEIMGIVGENGMGKTTLLRCLGGQLAIDGGKIQYSLLQKPDAFDIRKYIAFIPQRIPRWYGLLKDNLHFSASIAGIHGEENLLMVDYIMIGIRSVVVIAHDLKLPVSYCKSQSF